jgi:predicted transcriptional regulator
MKTATLPSLRVNDDLRAAAQSLLRDGETLSGFMLEAVKLHIERREAQHAFIAKGLRARESAHTCGEFVSANVMLERLDNVLAHARHDSKSAAK